MKILVTGGCGYLGSHTCCELLQNNYEVVIVDNLSNSKKNIPSRIESITGKTVKFYDIDLCDKNNLRTVFEENEILAVIHLAGLKGIDEANKKPLSFYAENVESTISLLEIMQEYNCKKLVFGSTAMVYGNNISGQITEDSPLEPENIFGNSKLMCEKILKDLYEADPTWSILVLRHFNPAGAHSGGLLGENIDDMPSTLIPRLVKVATGSLPEIEIYGHDYNTEDGTGRRDFTHVCDIARAHVKAIDKVLSTRELDYYNLGTGFSHSVLEVIKIFEKVNNVTINYTFKDRRVGDAPVTIANPDYTARKLGWQAEKDLGDICMDSYNHTIKEYIDKDPSQEETEYEE